MPWSEGAGPVVALNRVGARMLGEHPIHPVLLATDLGAAKDFYHG